MNKCGYPNCGKKAAWKLTGIDFTFFSCEEHTKPVEKKALLEVKE